MQHSSALHCNQSLYYNAHSDSTAITAMQNNLYCNALRLLVLLFSEINALQWLYFKQWIVKLIEKCTLVLLDDMDYFWSGASFPYVEASHGVVVEVSHMGTLASLIHSHLLRPTFLQITPYTHRLAYLSQTMAIVKISDQIQICTITS